jgi:hypothetical protein
LETANNAWRVPNSSSRNCSGSPRCPEVTRCSSGHLAGHLFHEPFLALGQGRDDRVGQLEGRPGAQAAGLDAPQHRLGFAQGGLLGDRRVDRAVDGDQIAGADELVQLDVMDVAAGAELGGVRDHEDVVAVGPDLGHGVALDTRLDRQGVEAEHLRQHLGGLLVADRDVHPDQPVVAGQQRRQVLNRMLLDAFLGYEANACPGRHTNVHPARHLLEHDSCASLRRRHRAGRQPGDGHRPTPAAQLGDPRRRQALSHRDRGRRGRRLLEKGYRQGRPRVGSRQQ